MMSVLVTSTFSVYHLFSGHYQVVAMDSLGFVVALYGLRYLRRLEKGDYVYLGIGGGLMVLCSTTTIIGRTEISYFFWSFMLPPVVFSILGDRRGMMASLFFFCLSLILMTLPETVLPSPPCSTHIMARYIVIYMVITLSVYYYETSHQMLIRYIQREKDRFESASKRDPLTGLANRRDISERTENERERQARSGRPFALILGDIDNFKHLNDTHGHDCGDDVLKRVAGLMKNQVRGIDCPSRWGGEEFLILLVDGIQRGFYKPGVRAVDLGGLKNMHTPALLLFKPHGHGRWIHDAGRFPHTGQQLVLQQAQPVLPRFRHVGQGLGKHVFGHGQQHEIRVGAGCGRVGHGHLRRHRINRAAGAQKGPGKHTAHLADAHDHNGF